MTPWCSARFIPAAMMFIPSIGGRSHDVSENTSDADIVRGCEVLAAAVAELCRIPGRRRVDSSSGERNISKSHDRQVMP